MIVNMIIVRVARIVLTTITIITSIMSTAKREPLNSSTTNHDLIAQHQPLLTPFRLVDLDSYQHGHNQLNPVVRLGPGAPPWPPRPSPGCLAGHIFAFHLETLRSCAQTHLLRRRREMERCQTRRGDVDIRTFEVPNLPTRIPQQK